jgi:uncharacterized protein YegP (UPF0339 family)
MHVEVFKGGGKQPWYMHLKAHNGKIITASEGYSSHAAALKAAKMAFPNVPLRDLTAETTGD